MIQFLCNYFSLGSQEMNEWPLPTVVGWDHVLEGISFLSRLSHAVLLLVPLQEGPTATEKTKNELEPLKP